MNFAEFQRFHEQMDEMWRRLSGSLPGSRFCPPLLDPPTDVYETADQVVVVAEIPGIEEQEVEIEVAGDHLALRGEKSDRQAGPDHRHTQMEICYGPFEKVVALPAAVDAEKAEVTYADGFLRIALPKKERYHQVRVIIRKADE